MKQKFAIFFLCVLSLLAGQGQVSVENLRCEMLTNPLGIDIKEPRFSWQLSSDQRNVQQTGYQIIVSSSKEKLQKGDGDVWNSGKINSSQSIHVAYAGSELQRKTQYFWKVRVVTNKGESAWSEPAYWSMGFLDKSTLFAMWIGYDKASSWDSITQWSRLSARYFRREFNETELFKRATVYVCGLGLYELHINGKKIGDQVLAPAPTDYRKSALYNTYDVTNIIRSGKNAIGVVVGNGRFFTMRQ